jgi:hypothetical protein
MVPHRYHAYSHSVKEDLEEKLQRPSSIVGAHDEDLGDQSRASGKQVYEVLEPDLSIKRATSNPTGTITRISPGT